MNADSVNSMGTAVNKEYLYCHSTICLPLTYCSLLVCVLDVSPGLVYRDNYDCLALNQLCPSHVFRSDLCEKQVYLNILKFVESPLCT